MVWCTVFGQCRSYVCDLVIPISTEWPLMSVDNDHYLNWPMTVSALFSANSVLLSSIFALLQMTIIRSFQLTNLGPYTE